MLKVILVEDEKKVLKGMAMVLGKDPEVELAGTAQNGLDGLNLIYKEHPDVVLTDIRMPGLNGLELIEQAQRRYPDIQFIIFSGFREFQYVQKAMGLGVLAYLEKPVTVKDLRNTLKRAGELVDYRKNYVSMKEKTQQVNRVMVEQALYSLMNQPAEMEQENINALLDVGEHLQFSTEMVVLCVGKLTGKEWGVDEYRRLMHALNFSLAQKQNFDIYTHAVEELLFFIYFNKECEIFSFYEEITSVKQEFEEEGFSFFAGISNVCQSIYELKNAFVEAGNAYIYASFLESEEIVRIGMVEYQNHIPAEITDSQYSMELNFRLQNYGECRKQIAAYLDYLKRAGIMPELLRHECLELIYLIRKLVLESGHVTKEQMKYVNPNEAMHMASAEETCRWTEEIIYGFIRQTERAQEHMEVQPSKIVKNYIDQHYAESLTLEILAQQVHMNPTYLSVIFKKEEGVSYSHYLAQVRIRHAMDLLEAGEKAKDVCRKVGYYDYRYFNRQFKKYTGMTPDTYKRAKYGIPIQNKG